MCIKKERRLLCIWQNTTVCKVNTMSSKGKEMSHVKIDKPVLMQWGGIDISF